MIEKLLHRFGFVKKEDVEKLLREQRQQITKQLSEFSSSLNEEINQILTNREQKIKEKSSLMLQKERDTTRASLEQLLEQAKKELTLRQEDKANVKSSIGWLKRDIKTATDRINALEKITYKINNKELIPNKNIFVTSEDIPLSINSKEAKETTLRQYVDESLKILNQNQKTVVTNTEKLLEKSKKEVSPKLQEVIKDVDKLKNPKIKRKVIQKDFNELFDSVSMKLKSV